MVSFVMFFFLLVLEFSYLQAKVVIIFFAFRERSHSPREFNSVDRDNA